MVLGGRRQAELPEDARDVLLDCARRDEEPLADRLVRAPLGHQLEHLGLAGSQRGDGVVPAAAPDELAHHRGVEGRASLGHALHGRTELLDVRDAVLEQVADAFRAVCEELHRVRRLRVLRQHEDADSRVPLPDLLRRLEAFVRVGRRHPDVHDRHVRRVRAHLEHQLVGVRGLADDLEAGVGEDAGDAFPEEDGIFGEDYAHGISARILVPSPGRLTIPRRPSRASTRSARPRRPEPRFGSAPPTPSSSTSTTA